MPITHAFVNPKADGGDATIARPSDWNDDHVDAAGTVFPVAPATGERFFRTDLGLEFYYDGTRWLSTQLMKVLFTPWNIVIGTGASATQTSTFRGSVPAFLGGSNIWLVSSMFNFYVNGGTALSGSHKWVATIDKEDSAASGTTIATHTIDSGASSAYRTDTVAIGALLGTTFFAIHINDTKTGTPGNLMHYGTELSYRVVAT